MADGNAPASSRVFPSEAPQGHLAVRPLPAWTLLAFGTLFCVVWAGALLAFPMVKRLPSGWAPVLTGLVLGIALVRSRRVSGWLDWLAATDRRAFLFALLMAAALARVVAALTFPREPAMDDAQFQRYAEAILRGEGYGAPGYLAWFPPGMTLLLTAWYWVAGPDPLWGKLLHASLGCLMTWQTLELARSAVSERTARLAALTVALLPASVFYAATLGYETLLAVIFVVVARLTLRAADSPAHWPSLVLSGALLGIGTLVKPVCLLVPFLQGLSWWSLGSSLRRTVPLVAVVLALLLLVVAPWTWRNHRVLGAFVLVSTNGGYTLWVANNPRATGLATRPEPLANDYDEVTRDRMRFRAALQWMASHPGRWAELALTKATYVWGTSSSIMSVVSADRLTPAWEAACKAIINVTWVALFVGCAVATFWQRAWALPGLVPGGWLIAYVFGLHLFFEANSRHHVPLLPFIALLASAGFTASGKWRRP
jgi:hypothetical protein